MYVHDRKRNPRGTAAMIDVLHIVVGVLVVICSVLAFVDPEKHGFLFPVIFWLAAALNGVTGWSSLQAGVRSKKKKAAAIALWVLAFLLFVIGLLSAVSVWR